MAVGISMRKDYRNFPYIVKHLVGEPNRRYTRGTHDMRYGNKGSLSVNLHEGVWKSFETKEGGGVYDFIKFRLRFNDNKQVTAWLKDFFGGDNDYAPPPMYQRKDPNKRYNKANEERKIQNKKNALTIWENANDPRGTPVEEYLEKTRGINLKYFNDIRYTESKLPLSLQRDHVDAHMDYAVMVALYRDIKTDEPVAIHRTYLVQAYNEEGEGGWVAYGKVNLGSIKNAVIKLTPDTDVYSTLYIAEGIETALTGLVKGFAPVWAMGSSMGLSNFDPLPHINDLTIFADNDDAGIKSAENCAKKWLKEGKEVAIFKAVTKGSDLNDELLKEPQNE